MNEEQKPHKTWTMLKKAIPPIIPTFPASNSGCSCIKLFDAQWNTPTGHDANAKQMQYIKGTELVSSSYPYCNVNITNGKFIDKNYLLFDGTGKITPVQQKWFATNNCRELFVLDGIGTIYTKNVEGDIRSLVVSETNIVYTHNNYKTILEIPGKDVRMLCAMCGRIIAYDKNGVRHEAYNSKAATFYNGMSEYTTTSYFFDGFVGKVYCMHIGFNYKGELSFLDKEWEYAKNRFRLN